MKNVLMVTAVVASVGCGGGIATESSGPSGSTSSGAPQGSAGPSASSPPHITEGATAVRFRYSIGGEAREWDDQCGPSDVTHDIDLASRQLVTRRCVREADGVAKMIETRRLLLSSGDFQKVVVRLDELHEVAKPKYCAWDGSTYHVEVTKPGSTQLYLPENYSCNDRAGAKYVAPTPAALRDELDVLSK